jgi:hypothetical protein
VRNRFELARCGMPDQLQITPMPAMPGEKPEKIATAASLM